MNDIDTFKTGVNISVNNVVAQHFNIMRGQLQSKLIIMNRMGNPARVILESTTSCKYSPG